jgi:hypothetical protein
MTPLAIARGADTDSARMKIFTHRIAESTEGPSISLAAAEVPGP